MSNPIKNGFRDKTIIKLYLTFLENLLDDSYESFDKRLTELYQESKLPRLTEMEVCHCWMAFKNKYYYFPSRWLNYYRGGENLDKITKLYS